MTRKTARRAALTLAGLAVTGGAIAGLAGTAHAAAPAGHPGAAEAGWYGWDGDEDGDEDDVVAVFRSHRQCEWAARTGERRGYWHDADCEFIRTGYRGHWRQQWGNQFHRSWHSDGWHYRGVVVLRAGAD